LKDNIIKAKISELIPDDKNFNKGTEYGNALIEKSFQKFGAGRSILLDKNNRIIAGNKSTENFGASGGEDVLIVESDGTKLIAVKRTDIDLDTPQGRELALADNATAKANIVWDEEIIVEEIGVEVAEEWGVKVVEENYNNIDLDSFFEEDNTQKENKFKIILEYTEDDYNAIQGALKKHSGSKEQIFFKLLGL
jgi:hypothetical protein